MNNTTREPDEGGVIYSEGQGIFREIYHSVDDAIMIFDAESGEIADVNETMYEMFGYTREDARELGIEDISSDTPSDIEETALEHLRTAAAGEAQVFDWRAMDSEGNCFWSEVSLQPMDHGGEGLVLAIVSDISERKNREQRLRRYKQLVESSTDMLAAVDTERTYFFANRQYREFHDISLDEDISSLPIEEVLGEEEYSKTRSFIEKSLSGETVSYEMTRVDSAGDERVLGIRYYPLVDESGTIQGTVAAMRDITERREYETKLKEQRDHLQSLNQVLRHDVRNDLQLITAYAENLERELEGEKRNYARLVSESAQSAVELMKTARNLAETVLTTGTETEEIPLAPTLRSQVGTISEKYDEAAVVVDDTIPDVTVKATDMLDSVFQNVLANAIHHNDKDFPEVHIGVTQAEDRVVVRVEDNGPGIPDEKKDAIFEKGEMGLDSEGTGIGLYLVKRLVDEYDGDVWITDADPEGAVVNIALPVAHSSE